MPVVEMKGVNLINAQQDIFIDWSLFFFSFLEKSFCVNCVIIARLNWDDARKCPSNNNIRWKT